MDNAYVTKDMRRKIKSALLNQSADPIVIKIHLRNASACQATAGTMMINAWDVHPDKIGSLENAFIYVDLTKLIILKSVSANVSKASLFIKVCE